MIGLPLEHPILSQIGLHHELLLQILLIVNEILFLLEPGQRDEHLSTFLTSVVLALAIEGSFQSVAGASLACYGNVLALVLVDHVDCRVGVSSVIPLLVDRLAPCLILKDIQVLMAVNVVQPLWELLVVVWDRSEGLG